MTPDGLAIVFTFALIMCLIAAAAWWLRGSGATAATTTGRNNEILISDLVAGGLAGGELASSRVSMSGPDTEAALARNPELITEEDA